MCQEAVHPVRMECLCTAIKAKGVILITVAYDLRDDETKTRLANCASTKQHFFDASQNSDLVAAFDTITKKLVKQLHIIR
jgi:hypothetical protein